jgi:sodium-dependent dicarboxylate transporter 2/3/5
MRHLPALAAATGIAALIWFGTPGLTSAGRATLLIFALAMIGWVMTKADDVTIALAAALALVAAGVVTPSTFYMALGSELIWLMIATFTISEVLRHSTLAERAASYALRRVRTVRGMFHALAAIVFVTAFVMPSPSARAALFLPIYLAVTDLLKSAPISKGLALLFPSVILLSSAGVLTGSGAHLLALDLLSQAAPAERIDYLQWLMLALPIALASCLAATELILWIFVRPSAQAPLALELPKPGRLSASQWFVTWVILTTVMAWVTTPWHGVSMGIVAIAAAVLLTQHQLSGVGMKTAVRGVEWTLVLFFAATVLLGQAIVSSGAGKWLADSLLGHWNPTGALAPLAIAFGVSAVALLSHLVVVSRSARAAILVPTFALPLADLGYSAPALVLLTVIGTGFCQTLPISSKTVTLFSQRTDGDALQTVDFVRLAVALLPVMLGLMLVFSLAIWPHLGFPLWDRE